MSDEPNKVNDGDDCPECHGSGQADDVIAIDQPLCHACNGTGASDEPSTVVSDLQMEVKMLEATREALARDLVELREAVTAWADSPKIACLHGRKNACGECVICNLLCMAWDFSL